MHLQAWRTLLSGPIELVGGSTLDQRNPTRNDTLEFCRRTRRNLEFIEHAKKENPQALIHVVTQLTLSLLGLVVFPFERLDRTIFDKTVAELKAEGWFGWCITLDNPTKGRSSTVSLGDFLTHLRNAVAHGRLTFSSDSANANEVAVTAEDRPNGKGAAVNWRAEIAAGQLREFCLRFLDFIDGMVG